MELPINSKINGMEIIHEGNVDEYTKKRVKFKNTNNTSSNQKYQLLLKTKIDKSELGKIKIKKRPNISRFFKNPLDKTPFLK